MNLVALIAVPVIGAILAALTDQVHARAPRWIALVTLVLALVISISMVGNGAPWLADVNTDWIPRFGVRFHLALDGISLALIVLTYLLGIAAVLASWHEITDRVGLFHLHLLLTLAGVVGVFLALDLFLFFVFWEVMLVPMYFLIALWGHERRLFAAFKFFIFTQASGLLMLVAIIALAFVHHRVTGQFTFDYADLVATPMTDTTAAWLFAGFFLAFAVKLPAVPLHTWLPDAHTQAPTGGSVILAGVLLKTGAYGLLRFVVPLFPETAAAFAPVALTVAVVSILYGAVLAFAQTDIKRLVAYTSVSHMGFVLAGLFAGNAIARQGAVVQMLAHGFSTGALFIVAGSLQARLHTRTLADLGGLGSTLPRLAALGLFFAIAALGLPGLATFVGEFLVLVGLYREHTFFAVVAALGLVLSAVYALHLVQQAFHGEPRARQAVSDYSLGESAVLVGLALALVWLGLYPQPVIDLVTPGLVFGQVTQPAP